MIDAKSRIEGLDRLLISADQTAHLLSLSKPKVYELFRRDDFPVIRLGGRRLVSVEHLKKWIEKQVANGTNGL